MKTFILPFLILFTPLHNYAQQAAGREISGTYAPGIHHNRNFVKNPGAEKNVLYTTNSAAIVTRTTSTPIMGAASYLIDATSSGQTVKFDTGTLDNNVKGQNCEARFTFTGDATLYKAYVEQGSTKITTDLTLTNESNARDVSIKFACGDLSSNSHLVIESTSSSSAAIKVDDVYLGKILGPVYVQPTQNYSAKVSSSGTVSDENQDFISGNCSVANTSEFTCTWNASQFGTSPTCTATGLDTSTAAPIVKVFTQATTTSVVIKTYNNSATATAYAFNLSCQRGAGDFVPPVLTPDQTDIGWHTDTCTSSWTANTTTTCIWRRLGENMEIQFQNTLTGAPTATALTFTLPGSRTIDTAKLINTTAGKKVTGWGNCEDTGTRQYDCFPMYNSSTSISVFNLSTSTNAVNATNPFTFGNTDRVEVTAIVPITGWAVSQNAPQLMGSVTTDSMTPYRFSIIETQYCGTNGTCPTPLKKTDDVTSITRLSTGTFDIAFAASAYSSKPICSYSSNSDNQFAQYTTWSSNTLRMVLRSTTAGTGLDGSGQIICIGPRQ